MELNSTIWGTKADNAVELGSNRNIYYSNFAGAGSLGEYRIAHGMSDPIDESVNCWQLADFSMFNSVAYCRRDGNNTPILDVISSDKPKSIFLAIAPAASNMTFNPAQSSNLMWSTDVTNSIYTGTNYKILPWFNYNDIMSIFQLVTRKFDSDGKPTGSNVSRSIYSYYHDTDTDDLPFTTNWKIIGINVRFAHKIAAVDTYQPFGEDVTAVSSAEMPFPQPNYYYSTGKYISYNALRYAGGVNSLGNASTSSAGGYGYQQGAYGQSNNAYIVGYSPDSWEKRSYLNSSNQLIEYFNCTLDYEGMLRQCATLGFWFNETIVTTSSAQSWTNTLGEGCTDDHVILPEIKNGRTTGNFKRGTAAGADPQAQWGADWRENAGYNGDKPYDGGGGDRPKPDPDSNPIAPTTPGFSLAVENGSVSYVITQPEWKRVWNDIYGGTKSQWKSLIEGLALYGSNPLNAILNYRWYPFLLSASQTDPMRLGSTVIKPITHVYHYISTASEAFNSSAAHFWWGDDKNFINTRKTKARLFLPFYGFYDLPTTMLLEKELTIQFQYNLPDDTAVWFIEFGGSIYDYVECQPYIEIPITGDNSLQIAAAKAQRNLSIAMTVGAAVAGAAIGGALGLTQGVVASGFGTAADVAESGILGTAGLLWGNGSYAQLAMGLGGAALGAAGPLAGGGVKAANTIMQSALQIGNLSTNVPVHSAGSDTTFLHMPMTPYVELYVNNIQDDFDENGYKVNVGIACDKWAFTSDMPENSLLQATGVGNMSTEGMELTEVQELNTILQSGFYL